MADEEWLLVDQLDREAWKALHRSKLGHPYTRPELPIWADAWLELRKAQSFG